MGIRALIFDFDGLILDTETPEVEVWRTIYAEHGHDYPMENWSQIIGGWGNSAFDPARALQELEPKAVDLQAVRNRHRDESDALIERAPVMPGVQGILAAAKRLGLRCAIASSSERAWVEPHLGRLGLLKHFAEIITGDDVPKGRTKPHPDIYLKALSALQLEADQVLVLEDSPNGIRAAHTAGLRVVGVPNPVTAVLGLEAELVLSSLEELPLDDILRRVDGSQSPRSLPAALQDATS
jgi:HAD superfamily hydrolase (TIGR01509 family)